MSFFGWGKSGPDTHPLHPTHTGRNESDAVLVQQLLQQECNNCQSQFGFSKPSYHCKTCDFLLCNNCSNGDKHPAHAEHELFIVYNNLRQDGARWRCNVCKKSNADLGDAFRYRCNLCDFDMCQECSRPLSRPLHQHGLIRTDVRQVYPQSGGDWLCDACGHNNGPGNYHPWHCQQCQFDLCDNCTKKLYSIFHEQHPLYKADSTLVYQRFNGGWKCDRCSRSFAAEINKYPYHCNECEFDLCEDCMRNTGTLSNYVGFDVPAPRPCATQVRSASLSNFGPTSSMTTRGNPIASPEEEAGRHVEQVGRPGPPPEDGGECVICLEKPKDATIVHGLTGHVCCCTRCALHLERTGAPCPICRAPIDRVIKQYTV